MECFQTGQEDTPTLQHYAFLCLRISFLFILLSLPLGEGCREFH